jgi:hypothetical protein
MTTSMSARAHRLAVFSERACPASGARAAGGSLARPGSTLVRPRVHAPRAAPWRAPAARGWPGAAARLCSSRHGLARPVQLAARRRPPALRGPASTAARCEDSAAPTPARSSPATAAPATGPRRLQFEKNGARRLAVTQGAGWWGVRV